MRNRFNTAANIKYFFTYPKNKTPCSKQTHTLILVIFLVMLNDFTAKNAKFIAKSAMFFCVLSVFLANFAVKFLKSCHKYRFQSKVCVCPASCSEQMLFGSDVLLSYSNDRGHDDGHEAHFHHT